METRAKDFIELVLHISGNTPKSLQTFKTLRNIREEYLKGCCTIEVVDLVENPQVSELLRKSPLPIKRGFGYLSNTERVLKGLGLGCAATLPFS